MILSPQPIMGREGSRGCPRVGPLKTEPEMGILFQEEGERETGWGGVLEADLRLISQRGRVGRTESEVGGVGGSAALIATQSWSHLQSEWEGPHALEWRNHNL